MALITDDDDIIIDESKIIEPDESEELDEELNATKIAEDGQWFDKEKMTIEWEGIIEDEEFDEDRDDIYEPYEEDPSLLDEEDDQ